MNILFFLDRYPGFGGIETVTTLLSNGFAEIGYGVTIISCQQANPELFEQLDNRVNVLELPNKNLLSVENKIFMCNEINNRKVDFLIHQHSYAKIFGLIVSIRNQVKCKILTVEHNTPDAPIKMYSNNLEENGYGNDWKFNIQKFLHPIYVTKCKYKVRKTHRYLYKYSDSYILLSERFVDIFKQTTALNDCNKLAWISNPVAERKENVNAKKEKIILYVGRIDKDQKRVDRLIRIFEQIYKEFDDWKLIIVGDGPHKKLLEAYVTQKSIARVYFEGFKTNVLPYYEKASILCITSNCEGWGLVFVESMQYGVIPFSYDSFASVYDIIENNKNGFIIKSFDENEYIRQLRLVMSDENLRQNLSLKASQKSQVFIIKATIEKWKTLFDTIL